MADQPLTTIRCTQCGHVVGRRDRKCALCGSPIEQNAPTGAVPPQWPLAFAGIVVFILGVCILVLVWRMNTGTTTATKEAPQQTRPDKADVIPLPKETGTKKVSPETSQPIRKETRSATPLPTPERPSQDSTVPDTGRNPRPPDAELPKAAVDALGLGKTHLARGDYDLAIRDLTGAVRLNPNYAEAFTNRGFAYLYKADYDRAIQDFGEAIRLQPNSDLFANRALAHFNKGDYERAIQDYGEAIRLSSRDAELFNDRGAAHAGKGDYDRAIQDYDQALRLKPNYPAALNNRGWAYSQKGERDRAIADYLAALKLNPADALRRHIETALRVLGVSPH